MVGRREIVLGILVLLFAEFASHPLARWLGVTDWQLTGLVVLACALYALCVWIVDPSSFRRSFKESWNRDREDKPAA